MEFPPSAIPATAALLLKAAIFAHACFSKVRRLRTRLCLFFIFCIAIQNVAEISFFLTHVEGWANSQTTNGKLWYGATILAIGVLMHLAIVMGTKQDNAQNNLSIVSLVLLYAPVAVLEAVLWLQPHLLIAGFRSMGYTITKIPGPYYFIIETYLVSYLCAALGLFLYGARKQLSSIMRLRNKLLLIGFFPYVTLVVAVLILLHHGYHGFNVTGTGPVALMFFAATATYALHQYRLVDVSYYVPWSKVRKQKVEFYQRIRQASSEIPDLRSTSDMLNRVADVMQCQVALVGGPSILLAVPQDDDPVIDDFTPSEFPRDQLAKIDRIVAAEEIADSDPVLHELMKRYKVGAVVPLNIARLPMHWLLLGERFQNHVYTSQDFKVVEGLFDDIGRCFVKNIFLLRSYLTEAESDVRRYEKRLATVRGAVDEVKQRLEVAEAANRLLREDNARRRRGALRVVEPVAPDVVLSGEKTLEQYLTDRERQIVAASLSYCASKSETAALLGTTEAALNSLIARYGLDTKEAE